MLKISLKTQVDVIVYLLLSFLFWFIGLVREDEGKKEELSNSHQFPLWIILLTKPGAQFLIQLNPHKCFKLQEGHSIGFQQPKQMADTKNGNGYGRKEKKQMTRKEIDTERRGQRRMAKRQERRRATMDQKTEDEPKHRKISEYWGGIKVLAGKEMEEDENKAQDGMSVKT